MFYNIKRETGEKIFRLFVLIILIKITYNNIKSNFYKTDVYKITGKTEMSETWRGIC